LSDGFAEAIKRSCSSLAEYCFELCESLFDWIEVAAIGRQIALSANTLARSISHGIGLEGSAARKAWRLNRIAKRASARGCREHMPGATPVSYAVFEPFSKGLVGASS
jgi:hypothetical protein